MSTHSQPLLPIARKAILYGLSLRNLEDRGVMIASALHEMYEHRSLGMLLWHVHAASYLMLLACPEFGGCRALLDSGNRGERSGDG